MTTLTWHRWTCANCGNTAPTLVDTRVTCICGITAHITALAPLATDEDFDAEDGR